MVNLPWKSSSTTTTTPFTSSSIHQQSLINTAMNITATAASTAGAATAPENKNDTTAAAATTAHRFLSRYEGFDSRKLSQRTNELERRFLGSGSGSGSAAGSGRMGAFGTTSSPAIGAATTMEEEKKENDVSVIGALTTTAGSNHAHQTHYHQQQQQDLTHLIQTSTSLSALLSTHHNMCLQSALANAERLERKRSEYRKEERDVVDWEGERKLLAAGGGERFGVLSTSADSWTRSRGGGGIPEIVPKTQVVTRGVLDQLSFHSEAIGKYLSTTDRDKKAVLMLLTLIREGMDEYIQTKSVGAAAGGESVESLHQYSNGLSLLESIVMGNTPSSSSQRGVVVAIGDGKKDDVTTARNVASACRFFSAQFRGHMMDVVREVQLDGSYVASSSSSSLSNDTNLTSVARDASTFAEIVLGSPVNATATGVWGRLFYCLRCGDLVAAKSVLASCRDVDAAVVDLVNLMAELQGGEESIFHCDGGDNNSGGFGGGTRFTLLSPSSSVTKLRRLVGDLYEGVKTRFASLSSSEQMMASYQAACLAMLGGSESISETSVLESSGLVKTVEDYLYASLWHALHLAEDASSSDVGLKYTCEAVARLGSLVKEWGPSYFEQEDGAAETAVGAVVLASQGNARDKIPTSGGWAYALPLLACQQYGSALAYLAEVGGCLGLMQAAHAAVVLDAAGIDMIDFSLEPINGPIDEESRTLLPMLVSSFSASLQGADVVSALKYLMLLSGKGKVLNTQVRRLILETRQFEVLAGKIEQDGSRSKAALDEYFSAKEISSLLADAAGEAVRVGKSADGAELLVLAGRYSALFSLMNRELASHLTVNTEEEFNRRQFWFNAARQFHDIHLAGGRNYVQTTLSSEGNMSLGSTFQLLLNLIVFFDRHRDQQYEGAWKVIDDLDLFPRNDSDLTMKMNQFNTFDSYVRREFHHVVVASMEVLCHLYRTAKRNISGASSFQHSAIEQQINELVRRARLLVTFAGVINLPLSGEVDTYAKLAQLEKNMM